MSKISLDARQALRIVLSAMLQPHNGEPATADEISELVASLLVELEDERAKQGGSFIASQIQRAKGQGGTTS